MNKEIKTRPSGTSFLSIQGSPGSSATGRVLFIGINKMTFITKICLYCKNEFIIDLNHKNQKFCSHSCYAKSLINKKQSQITIEKRSKSLRGKKRAPFSKEWKKNIGLANKKRKHTEETRRKLSEMHKENKIPLCIPIRHKRVYRHYNNLDYRLWREKVFERDNYTCQKCGIKSGNGKAVFLHPHHIKSYTHYPKLRYKISNGITLCKDCNENLHWG